MPYLVQLLIPLYSNEGHAFGQDLFAHTRRELTEQFGGLTAYTRAPARGLWKTDEGRVERDDIVIFEAMIGTFDRAWWQQYRDVLRRRFSQDELLIRVLPMDVP